MKKHIKRIVEAARKVNPSMLLLIIMSLFGAWILLLSEPVILGQPYNASALVNTTVNITNSAPLVERVVLDTPIDLTAYDNRSVFCNATVFDYDNDSLYVNATFYIENLTDPSATNDQNYKYSNGSCSRSSPQDLRTNWTCNFPVQYFANNDTRWLCNVTATDSGHALNVSATNRSNYATVNPLVAIKIPLILDYGNLAVNDISNDTLANITNAGNRDANISVEGYGATPGDGYAFICSFGSISLNYERYKEINGTAFPSMTPVTGTTTMLSSYYVAQRLSETTDSLNSTYWKVQIPIGAGGICNGKLLFTASDRGN
jgi:hypothetical protein